MELFVLSNGKRLGPFTTNELIEEVRHGRIKLADLAWKPGQSEWLPLHKIPEALDALIPQVPNAPIAVDSQAPSSAPPQDNHSQVVLFDKLTKRQKKLAVAGFILGIFALVGCFLPALLRTKERAQAINCANNLRQIVLAFKLWSLDNGDRYPFKIPASQGGAMELCTPDQDGFDQNPAAQLLVMSNELSTTAILVCPADSSKRRAVDWLSLRSTNVSYQIHVESNVDENHPLEILAICPIHGTRVLCDGSVHFGERFHGLEASPKMKCYTEPIQLDPKPSASEPNNAQH